ncbi:calcium-binding protein [Falsiroseomonas oryzae]|uniref:calcium-binding protein n=1 Tax=Falsiroseomonas oryzae TaxID=2766473 RepID=UPI0022EB3AD3|nr:M10 family metallopeptidase C-terminal domain-containing protein [Roseomonas sp. MO-31]
MPIPVPIPGQDDLLLSPDDGTSAGGAEYQPRVTGTAGGGFVAAWHDFLPTTTARAPSGYPYAIDADGGVTIMLKRFGADGAALGPAVPVSSNLVGNFDGHGVVTLTNGNVAVGWGVFDSAGGASRIGARVIDPATGATVGAELPLATGGAFAAGVIFHQIVALSGGRAGVMYVDGAGTDRLQLAIVNADGSAGAVSTLVTQGADWLPATGIHDAAAALQGANADILAVALRTYTGPGTGSTKIVFRNLDGSPAALPTLDLTPTNPDAYIPVLAARPDGGLVVAHSIASPASTEIIRVYRLDAAGALEGPPTTVTFNTGTFGTTELCVLSDGSILVAISGIAAGGFDPNILVQRLHADGTLDGGVTRVDSAPNGEQSRPELAQTGDGSVIAAFFDARSFSDYQIRAARLEFPEPILDDGTPGADTITGSNTTDTLGGGAGNDSIFAAAGNDDLDGGLGADTVDAGAGNDSVAGGGGNDSLSGGTGNDVIYNQGGDNTADGGDGNDVVYGGAGVDSITGAVGNDTLYGGLGDDRLLGGAGNDEIYGGGGADTIEGGTGADTLVGGDGADVFRYGATAESNTVLRDLILTFARGVDRIDLSAIDTNAATPADEAFAFIGYGTFTGGAGVAEVRLVRDAALGRTLVEVDGPDANAVAEMVIIVAGGGALRAEDFIL